LIDELLAGQQSLSAVEEFARAHERHQRPALEKHYRRLLPASPPAAGQQYAFEVDLDQCSGCKACVTACHALNGLDEDETWRSVGLLVAGERVENRCPPTAGDPNFEFRTSDFGPRTSDQPRTSDFGFQQHITTACHHCVDPGCLNGCPVLAYDKDPVTGIVRHLDDQCIGCQYCVMKCPYEVPQYSARRGIVRKCDLCSQRLAVGEAPACVQACPNEAIRITLVEQDEIRAGFRPTRKPGEQNLKSEGSSKPEPRDSVFAFRASFELRPSAFDLLNPFLPSSPNPAITLPTTRYISRRPLPAYLLAGDHHRLAPAAPHLPLVFLLVLSQLAVGASIASALLASAPLAWSAAGAILAALGLGTLHLGRPLKAWRAFLGWRTSWFSREVVGLGIFCGLACATAGARWLGATPLAPRFLDAATDWVSLGAALTGLLGVACSAMIYVDTRREFWSARQSFTKFFGTTALLGLAVTLALHARPALAALLIAVTAAKLAFEHRIFRQLVDEETPAPTPLNQTARLLGDSLGLLNRVRVACGLIGGVVLPAFILLHRPPAPAAAWLPFAALALCLAGELLERALFFRAVAPDRMPGGVA
jgi:Fe-S-cluster-containing dehydrogenase component/DMSO reductase anchor subunit